MDIEIIAHAMYDAVQHARYHRDAEFRKSDVVHWEDLSDIARAGWHVQAQAWASDHHLVP